MDLNDIVGNDDVDHNLHKEERLRMVEDLERWRRREIEEKIHARVRKRLTNLMNCRIKLADRIEKNEDRCLDNSCCRSSV